MTAWLLRANLLLAMAYALVAFAAVMWPTSGDAKRSGVLMLAPSVAVLTYFLLGASASELSNKAVAMALVHTSLIAGAAVNLAANRRPKVDRLTQTDRTQADSTQADSTRVASEEVRWNLARYATVATMAAGLVLAAWGAVIPA